MSPTSDVLKFIGGVDQIGGQNKCSGNELHPGIAIIIIITSIWKKTASK